MWFFFVRDELFIFFFFKKKQKTLTLMHRQPDSDNRYVFRDALQRPTGVCIGGKPFGQQQAGPSPLAAAAPRPPPSPSRQPVAYGWQTLLRLAKKDLYLVFDLLEVASILVREGEGGRLGCGGEKGHRDPRFFSDA